MHNAAKKEHEVVGEEARGRLGEVLATEYQLYTYVRCHSARAQRSKLTSDPGRGWRGNTGSAGRAELNSSFTKAHVTM